MNEEVIDQKENEVVDIHPLKKGKRILVFIADFFIHFFLTFFLFNVACAPIGKAITNFESKNEEHLSLTSEMYQHYYKSGVLLKNDTFAYYDVTAGVEYSYRCFLSYFVIDSEETIDANYPQYGHKIENNNVYHFYHDIRNNDEAYTRFFNLYNEKDGYFVFDGVSNSFVLKNEVKTEVLAFYDSKDEMGSTGQSYYDNIMSNLFNPLMAEVFSDIDQNDLHYEGEHYSFLQCKNRINELQEYHNTLMSVCTLIAHFISWTGLFLIIPLANHDRKTLAMIFMKVEKVNVYSLNNLKVLPALANSLINLFLMLLGTMFIPSLLVPFNTLFSLHYLMYCSIFALVLIIADLIFLLINQYNRSLSDYLSNALYLSEEEMNELYRAKGYKI